MKKLLILFSLFFFSLLSPSISYANNPDQPHSSLTSTSVPADGKTQSVITVTLLDRFGNPVVGHSVSISDPNNGSAGITTINGTTTSSGQAQFGITSNNAQTDSLNVLDITTGSVLDGLGTVTFFSLIPTAAGYCANPAPASYPVITSAVANSSNQITLTWLPAASPVTYYVLSFGTASGNYPYGNPNMGNVTSYTVGDLKPGTKYYFRIKGVNVCTPGPSSNEFAAVTLGGTVNTVAVPTILVPSKLPVVSNSTPNPVIEKNQPVVSPTEKPAVLPELQPTPASADALVLGIVDFNSFTSLVIFFAIVAIAGGAYWIHHTRIRKTFKLRK